MFTIRKPTRNLIEMDDICMALERFKSDTITTIPMLKGSCSERASANVSQCFVITPDYSFNVGFTRDFVSLEEFAWHSIPRKKYALKDVEAIDVTNEGMVIYFSDPNHKPVSFNIMNVAKSSEEILNKENLKRSFPLYMKETV